MVNILRRLFKKTNDTFPGWHSDSAFIFFLVLVFCLRFYLFRFIFQGDVIFNLYLHGNPELFRGGWDPYIWGYLGWYPLFGGLFPLNYPMHVFIEKIFHGSVYATLRLLQVNAVLSLFLLAFFLYLLFRFLGRSRFAAMTASIIICFSGFHVHTGIRELDLFYLHSFMFVPLALIFLIQASQTRKIKWAILAGLSIGISLLSGGNVPLFLFIPAFILAYAFKAGLKKIFCLDKFLISLFYSALALSIGIVIGMATLLPALKYMGLSCRSFEYPDYIKYSGSALYTLITSLYRDWWPRHNMPLALGQYHEFDSFVGLPIIFLGLWGMSRPNREIKAKWIMFLLAIMALCLMHIKYLPYLIVQPISFLLAKVSIRYPYRFFIVFQFSLAFFAACGIDSLRDFCASRRRNAVTALVGLGSLAYFWIGIGFWKSHTGYELQLSFLANMTINAVIIFFIFFSCLSAKRIQAYSRNIFPAAMACLTFVFYLSSFTNLPIRTNYAERGNVPAQYPPLKKIFNIMFDSPTESFRDVPLKTPYRIFYPWLPRGNAWAVKAKAYIAFENPVDDPATSRYLNNYYHCIGSYDSALFDLYNVRFLAINEQYSGTKLKRTPLLNVYFNPDAMDRFFIAHGARFFNSEKELWDELRFANLQDLKKNVWLLTDEQNREEPAAIFDPGKEGISIKQMQPTRIELEARFDSPGYLVASELWFPEWKVKVDGKKEMLLRAYGTFRAIRVPTGVHQIEFRFRDRYAAMGMYISTIGLLLVFAALLLGSKE